MSKRRVTETDEELRAFSIVLNEPHYLRDADESERAVHDILEDLRLTGFKP